MITIQKTHLEDRFCFISGNPAVVILARANKLPTAEALLLRNRWSINLNLRKNLKNSFLNLSLYATTASSTNAAFKFCKN